LPKAYASRPGVAEVPAADIRGATASSRMAAEKRLTKVLYFHNYKNMEIKDAIEALSALAQETRLEIFRLLVRVGREGLPPGQIAERFDLAGPTLSFHLNQLRQAGLITFRREGRSLIYAADYAAMNALMAYLSENCCGDDASACGVSVCEPDASAIPSRKEIV
jgi:DNA-binding transcriptional ArsR family regulator